MREGLQKKIFMENHFSTKVGVIRDILKSKNKLHMIRDILKVKVDLSSMGVGECHNSGKFGLKFVCFRPFRTVWRGLILWVD